MPPDEGFLQAIIENPDDDTPRLVYADWLDEHGQPERAEFIRIQIALEALAANAPERPALVSRARALLNQHRAQWTEGLPDMGYPLRFRRGFVDAVDVSDREPFAQQLKQLVALAPVRVLTVGGQDPNARHLHAAAPYMTRLRRLQFGYPNFGAKHRRAETFFARPELRRLTALNIMGDRNGSGLTDTVAGAILHSRWLAGLTELTLIKDFRGLAAPLIRALAVSPHMARLERLSLEQSSIDADSMQALGHSPHLRSLRELDLGGCEMPQAAWETLLTAPAFVGLRRLYLWNARLSGGEGRPSGFVGQPQFQGMGALVADWRGAVLERFGEGVVDLKSESYRRWYEPVGEG